MAERGRARRRHAAVGAPTLSLTTDFGTSEPFVGLMKAVILARCPGAQVVDLTHEVAPFAVGEAGFWLERSFNCFPDGTIHVAVVDPGVGSSRSLLGVRLGGHIFLAPDNGLLGNLAAQPGAQVRRVADAVLRASGRPAISATFHGRDLFAPLAADLAAARLAFDDLGPVAQDWVPSPAPAAGRTGRQLRGQVILIDRYGNCFSNLALTSEVLCHIPHVAFGGSVLPVVRTYADRPPGTAVALLNSFGIVEAACVEGRADAMLDLRVGSPVVAALPAGGGSGDDLV